MRTILPAASWWWIAMVLALVLSPQPVRVDGPAEPTPWWHRHDVAGRLALTVDQLHALDAAFEWQRAERLADARLQKTLERRLDLALQRGESDEEILGISDRLQQVRKIRNVRRTLMLCRMYRVLTPDQRTVLVSLGPRAPRFRID
jgi:Spy/CpxP family protein refolding chaperone